SPEAGGEGVNRRTQKVHAMRRHSYRDMWSSDQKQAAKGLDDSLSMDELEQLLDQFDPNSGGKAPAGRASILRYWNSSRQRIDTLLQGYYAKQKLVAGQEKAAESG